ncbi:MULTISPECIES: GNAT family N-acetyltransferase [Salinivibrio]|uniref:N-acetyltransferase n=1 Tax=Salinivibrio kushneri TaxID=1908198 RepID=A0AB36JZC7_9GAMM|nr:MULTISPECIES: N-acetyltransferase [Salinivibrio]ODP95729.1 hypothetical protein BGL48_06380 [Salinivibrio sp. BNH]OOE40432.1 N-acetyltransferase [Salinivibrio kushneri]OOE50957.1 N-acetyltransferase [Salinivibrio kushneri]OOE55967.1 N-acetyltransferase [Salinivibrio kushneri]OOE56758.1 N-acetyltransferase [Salinivibrio kushneri]
MNIVSLSILNPAYVAQRVSETFTHSEGADTGEVIHHLIDKLLGETPREDCHGWGMLDGEQLVGAVFFSRLTYPHTDKVALLSPMAIYPDYQRQGHGKALINAGLEQLRTLGYQAVVTYGDPAFYTQLGFHPADHIEVVPPHTLSYPHGWLAQSLIDSDLPALGAKPCCVDAFNQADLW